MTTQLAIDLQPTAPLQRATIEWMGFTLDTEDATAEALFIRCHGHPPRLFVRDGAILKVGPIEEGES